MRSDSPSSPDAPIFGTMPLRVIAANDNAAPLQFASWMTFWWPFLVAWALPPALMCGLVITLIWLK